MHRFGLTARAKSKSPSGIEDRSNWLVSKSYVTARGVALDLDRKEPRADTSETGALGANQIPAHNPHVDSGDLVPKAGRLCRGIRLIGCELAPWLAVADDTG